MDAGTNREPGDTAPEPTKDDLLVAALAAGRSYTQAADLSGYGRTTVQRRMADPAFRARVAAARRALVDQAVAYLTSALLDAATHLHRVVTSGESEGNRLRAAVALLELGLRYDSHADLAERVAALEAAGGANAPGRPDPLPRPEAGRPEPAGRGG